MKIHRSVKIPPKVSTGDPVKAEHHNAIIDALQSCISSIANSTVQSGADIGVRPGNHGGLVLFIKKIFRGGSPPEEPYTPWKPTFYTTGEEPNLVYKCRFNLGSVNTVPASNWNAEHTLPSAEDTFRFVVLDVTTANGKVSAVAISLSVDSPETDTVTKDVPPISHKILLGAVGRDNGKMIIARNLQMTGVEVFRESKSAPAVGAEPFHRWWRWQDSLL